MSTFDPDTFMQTSTDQSMDTEYPVMPEDEYQAFINKVIARKFVDKETGEDRGILDVLFEVSSDKAKKATGQDTPIAKMGVFLELEENGALALGMGKNVKLGKLREAAKQNKPGKPWSPPMLEGAGPFIIKVVIDIREEGTYNKVVRVAAAK